MIRMFLITLVSLYLCMVVLGRPLPVGDGGSQVAETAKTALASQPPPPEPILAEAQPAEAKPSINPVRYQAMPGPSLRPSPEHVTKAVAVAPLTGQIFRVAAKGANVRGGQGTDHPVVGRLARNEDVLVVADPGNGWVQVRIEGDGVSGWMAKRLLHPPP